MAARRGYRWTGSESPGFDAFVVGVLMVDMMVEGVLAIVGRVRRVAAHRQDDLLHRSASQRRQSA